MTPRKRAFLLSFGFFIVLGILLFLKIKWPDIAVEIIIGLIIGFATLYINISKNGIENDKMVMTLMIHFNSRFDGLNDELNYILSNKKDEIHNRPKNDIIQDYLNLCSEEYMWYKKGRIDKNVWQAWKKGIEYYLTSDEIKEHFKREKKFNISYYGLFDAIEILHS